MPHHRVQPAVPVAVEAEGEEGEGMPVALAESRSAYERAARIQEATAQQLPMATETASLPPRVAYHVPTAAPEVQGLLRDLRSQTQVRRAFVAALIFGPPKALEQKFHVLS
jgi:hypothetical protein